MDKKLGIIVFTVLQWLCVLGAAYFALQEPHNVAFDTIGAIMYLILASICEWIKHKFIHHE